MISSKSRQQHLNEMGIPQWYARYRLPGAAQSPELLRHEFIETPANIASIIHPKKSQTENDLKPESAMAKSVNSLPKLPDLDKPKKVPEKVQEISPVDQAEVFTHSTGQETTIRLYKAGAILITTDSKQDVPLSSEQTLLQNILNVSGITKNTCAYEQSFTWPVFHSQKMPVNQQHSQRKLTDKWLSSPLSESIHVFMHFGTLNKDLIESLVGDHAPLFLAFEHSLAELLSIPTRKLAIWQKLLPNLERLKLV